MSGPPNPQARQIRDELARLTRRALQRLNSVALWPVHGSAKRIVFRLRHQPVGVQYEIAEHGKRLRPESNRLRLPPETKGRD